ncbi:MAG: DNA-3-methyladenine glycosylase 2 family protein [Solirubrobacterales bacterium]|jgi:DNA-3-methyladenine glycosylase II|nr:DNA-3-methyladenine glycosylase 2 family protein [Solirubrobacterales bacterium]
MEHVRVEIRPAWPFRLPRGGMDGVARRRGTVLERLVHVEGERAIVRAAQPGQDHVVVGAWSAGGRDVCEEAIGRMRFAMGVDDDLGAFYERYRFDPLIGPSVRRTPHLRVTRRPNPFEALAWAVCEQLIEYSRAVEIERRIVRRWGERCGETGLRDVPDAARVAGIAPAELESCDLGAGRALALRRAAREVASGRVDLHAGDHERGWARLRAIPGIGSWTIEVLALLGQGRYDVLPAGDLAYRKLVGELQTGGRPGARVEEDEVRAFFAPYTGWAGLAGAHALRSLGRRGPAQLAA